MTTKSNFNLIMEKKGIIDLKETIFNDRRKIFKPLRNIDFFKSFTLDSWTMTWSNEADFSPEFLYELATKNKEIIHKEI